MRVIESIFHQSSSFISGFLKPSLLGKLPPFQGNPKKIKNTFSFFLKIQKLSPGTDFCSVFFLSFPHVKFLFPDLWLSGSLIYMIMWKKFIVGVLTWILAVAPVLPVHVKATFSRRND